MKAILLSLILTSVSMASETTCHFLTCLKHADGMNLCTKLNQEATDVGPEFLEFAKRETGTPGEIVMLECVSKGKQPIVVTGNMIGVGVSK